MPEPELAECIVGLDIAPGPLAPNSAFSEVDMGPPIPAGLELVVPPRADPPYMLEKPPPETGRPWTSVERDWRRRRRRQKSSRRRSARSCDVSAVCATRAWSTVAHIARCMLLPRIIAPGCRSDVLRLCRITPADVGGGLTKRPPRTLPTITPANCPLFSGVPFPVPAFA